MRELVTLVDRMLHRSSRPDDTYTFLAVEILAVLIEAVPSDKLEWLDQCWDPIKTGTEQAVAVEPVGLAIIPVGLIWAIAAVTFKLAKYKNQTTPLRTQRWLIIVPFDKTELVVISRFLGKSPSLRLHYFEIDSKNSLDA